MELYFRDGVLWQYLAENGPSTVREVYDAVGYKVFNAFANCQIALNRLVTLELAVREYCGMERGQKRYKYRLA